MKKTKTHFHNMSLFFWAYCMFCLSLTLHSPTKTFAQEFDFQREVDTIPVIVNGMSLPAPFAGGIGESKPVFADIDSNGTMDMFAEEQDGIINFYRVQFPKVGTLKMSPFQGLASLFSYIFYNHAIPRMDSQLEKS